MIRILLLLLFITNSICAQYIFSDLKYVDINSSYLNGKFGFKENSKFKLINKICTESMDCFMYDELTTLIGYWDVDDKTRIELHYTEAPSDDPTFIAVLNKNVIFRESGTTLHFKGNTLYVEGIDNSYFNKKRKFQFTDNNFKEVKPSFYHIGIKGKLNYPIQIFTTETFSEKLAYLPKDYDIEIVLGQTGGEYNDLEKILIKTDFGLIGWFNFKKVAFDKPLIDEFYYHGD